MALQTPRRFGARPSLGSHSVNTASSPNLSLAAKTALDRKASYNALTGTPGGSNTSPGMANGAGSDIEVGDTVDVPGGMYGVVKFIGTVHGKKGIFGGVELAREYAARGKNDGDVDGTRYFTTSVPGAGIFLPIHRAQKRTSTNSSDTFPPTPTTPAFSSFNAPNEPMVENDSPPISIPKFSQSMGPGARAPSPMFKPKGRPSLPRPESPYRQKPNLTQTPGRGPSIGPAQFSKSSIGAPRFTASPAPPVKAGMRKPGTPGPPRPYSRNNSRLGHHPAIDEDGELTPTATVRPSEATASGFTPKSRSTSGAEEEVHRLKKKLEERDRQLKEQAASLAEMESSLVELSNMMPADGGSPIRSRSGAPEDADAAQLRALLREKNEKISMLTAEFDNHRADFRSTIDTLEMASTETVRVYEKKVEDLTQEVRELNEGRDDVESVAQQLKQLEELVQELEEGLEDARRGEAEARGEVEFLRGEVERGRSELRREREKAAAAIKGANREMDGPLSPGGSREVEQRDDEIRGLKAIIHSLSSGHDIAASPSADHGKSSQRNGTSSNAVDAEELSRAHANLERLEREKDELQGMVKRKTFREEEMEREIEKLRHQLGAPENRDSVMSDKTAVQDKRSSGRDSKGTVLSWRASPRHEVQVPKPLESMLETDSHSSASESQMWCEFCDTGGHDILNCTNMAHQNEPAPKQLPVVAPRSDSLASAGMKDAHPAPLSASKKAVSPGYATSPGNAPNAPLPNPFDSTLVAGKGAAAADPNKWCALCERDGHDATACPFEDAF